MMDLKINYRPARAVDADQVHRLMTAVADEEGALTASADELSPEDIRGRIRNATNRRNRIFYVATDDERVIGMVTLESRPFRAQDHVRYLSVAVDPHYRRRGIARELMRIALEWAHDVDKVQKIETQVRSINEPGITLLKKHHFHMEGTLVRHTQLSNGKQIDDLILARFVDNSSASTES
ncbi:MAG: GNAT family protein [Candidatus Lernaella stagnicola]|nr:GNAT family protein [Candidatus Lernaella stagnicola]